MDERCRRIAESGWFQRSTIALIVGNAVLMGAETWPTVSQGWEGGVGVVHALIQLLFVVELAIRIAAHGRRPWRFFRGGWNTFDFLVVALSLLPAAGPLATVVRLARVLRVARMVSGIQELRLIVGTMLRSIPSMGHVIMLLGLLIYVYAVIGCQLFSAVDPAHWGNLARGAHTLFVVITLEGWVDLMAKSSEATPWAWFYYSSFIVVAVFVVINLFIAVVINNLEKVRAEEAAAHSGASPSSDAEVERLAGKVEELTKELRALRARL